MDVDVKILSEFLTLPIFAHPISANPSNSNQISLSVRMGTAELWLGITQKWPTPGTL